MTDSNNKDSNTSKDVVIALKAIVRSINPILEDIRANSTKRNLQTTDANKVILKEIAYKLRKIKNDMITLYHPIETIQSRLKWNNSIKTIQLNILIITIFKLGMDKKTIKIKR